MGQAVTVNVGESVVGVLRGHSDANGAAIPEGSSVAIASSDPAVAGVDAVTIPPGGAAELSVPVVVLAAGVTQFDVTVTTPAGQTLTDSAVLTVEAVAPGLVRVSFDLQKA